MNDIDFGARMVWNMGVSSSSQASSDYQKIGAYGGRQSHNDEWESFSSALAHHIYGLQCPLRETGYCPF
jgi:hypothetical protein